MIALRSLCVYCGSSPGNDPRFVEAARALGALLAAQGIRLVYGGARIGVMGAVADAALAAGGAVVGVIPHALTDKEVAHDGLTEMHVVDSMHQRKAMMADLSDGFIALPGGIGTFEELFEIWTWGQLGIHAKPCGLLNVAGYYDLLVAVLDGAADAGFIRPRHRGMLLTADSAEALLGAMRNYQPPATRRWIGREET
ncbi:MAG: TIGR00730 family Rossman fold protein [Methylobacterium sp.]|nr:TIGR00730 family Rossman fold protein [Methylobacterium sp.]